MHEKIVSVTIGPMPKAFGDPMPKVTATFEDGTVKVLFEYYPDEISFEPGEFTGLTEQEAYHLYFEKDRAYIQSP